MASCCNEKVVVENCITVSADCGSPIQPLFDASLGIAPAFAVIQITNTGSCPAAFFTVRTFDTGVTPPIGTPFTTALTTPASGFLDIVAPNSTETITINDMSVLAFGCAAAAGAALTNCNVTVKITSTFCVPSCGTGCGECKGACTEPVLVESCVNTQGVCGTGTVATGQRIFNGSLGTIPKFTVLQVNNTGQCPATLAVLRSFDTGFVTPGTLTGPLTGIPAGSSEVFIISDAAVIEAFCTTTSTSTPPGTCSVSAVLKSFFCVASCNPGGTVEMETCKVSFRGRDKGSCTSKVGMKTCTLSFL